MGYTTTFDGQFTFIGEPTIDDIRRINEICDDPDTAENNPGSYCQWEPTSNFDGLKWDGGEKFYYYDKWLQYLMDNVLTPAGIGLEGSVTYQGEEVGDNGTLYIDKGVVMLKPTSEMLMDLDELKSFKDFVLTQKAGLGYFNEWKRLREQK